MVEISRITENKNGISTEKSVEAHSFQDQSYYQTTIRHGNGKAYCNQFVDRILSYLNFIWEKIKSFFSCCFPKKTVKKAPSVEKQEKNEKNSAVSSSNVPDKKKDLEKMNEFYKSLEDLKGFFLKKLETNLSDSQAVEAFKKEWKEKFDQLPPELQKIIIYEDLKKSAIVEKYIDTDKDVPPEEIHQFIETLYQGKYRENSLDFIRNLNPQKDKDGVYFDPMNKNQVPYILDIAMQSIQSAKKNLETSIG